MVEGPGQDSYSEINTMNDEGSSENYTYTFSKEESVGSHGEYDLKAFVYNGSENDLEETGSITVTMDGKSPSVSVQGSDYAQEDPTLEVEVSDEHTGVGSFSVDATNGAAIEDDGSFDSCASGETCTVDVEVDTSDLDSGNSFELQASATDDVGNPGSDDKSFTYDTSYEGDTSPEFDPSSGNILLQDDEEETLEITLDGQDDAEQTDITVTCYDGDDDDFGSETQNVDDDGETVFECDVEGDDYAGTTQDIYVEMCDQAGNCEESDTQTYSFDETPPIVSNLGAVSEASSFNSNFEVSFDAADDASGVEKLEYFFDVGTDEGDGIEVDYSDDKDSFEADPSSLPSGDNTLYVRARDNAGRWSDPKALDFEYYPNLNPEVSIETEPSIEVTAGSSKTLKVSLENSGRFYIGSVDFSVSSPVFSESRTVEDLVVGEQREINLELNPSEEDIGSYDLDISTSGPSTSRTVDLRVKATESQRSEISSSFDSQKTRFEEVRKNITRLRNQVDEKKRERLDSNFTELNESINNAEEAMENGKYYKVKSEISDIESEFSKASESYQAVKEEHKSAQTKMMVMILLGLIVFGGVGTGGFQIYSDRFDVGIEPEDLKELGSDKDVDLGALESLKDSVVSEVESLTDSDHDEAEEFKWDGFKDH